MEVIPWEPNPGLAAWLSSNCGATRNDDSFDVAILKLAPVSDLAKWPTEPAPGVPPPPRPLRVAEYRPFTGNPDMKIAAIGCPHGMPLKWTSGKIVTAPSQQDMLTEARIWNKEKPLFLTTLEVFPGKLRLTLIA